MITISELVSNNNSNKIEITLNNSEVKFLEKYKWIIPSELFRVKLNEVKELLTPKINKVEKKVRDKSPNLQKEFQKILEKYEISYKKIKSKIAMVNNKYCVIYKNSKQPSNKNQYYMFTISKGTYDYLKENEDFAIILLCGRNISLKHMNKLIDKKALNEQQTKLIKQPIIEFALVFNKKICDSIELEKIKMSKNGWIITAMQIDNFSSLTIGNIDMVNIFDKIINNFELLDINKSIADNIRNDLSLLANNYYEKMKLIEKIKEVDKYET